VEGALDATDVCWPCVNYVGVKWQAGGSRWAVGVWLVKELAPDDLLLKLKKVPAKVTREMAAKMLNGSDDVAVTALTVSLCCPLGKVRMKVTDHH
jgi:hypothetical protein